jgi:hypothetical protein
VKEFLSRAGRSFSAKNVDDDDAAYAELLALGIMSVPVTVVGATAVKGFNPKALTDALNALDLS